MSVQKDTLRKILFTMQEKMNQHRDYLSDLDREIGDGDHGINMSRGFQEVKKKLEGLEDADLASLLKNTGMTLAFKVGGASGPLYGTAFMKAADQAKGKEELHLEDLPLLLAAAISGIQLRGKAVAGEKTMLDTLIPALEALKEAISQGKSAKESIDSMLEAAKEGAEYTKTIKATKGRASYVGERSIGHMDPGAASSLLLLEAIQEVVFA